MDLEVVSVSEAKNFIAAHHYATNHPAFSKLALAWRRDGALTAVALWGLGVRPRHTIQKLFPSLTTADYLELNRLCLLDELPRNSETEFIAQNVRWFKKHKPELVLLFSWADGIRGKPGYVYQAANWLYGGFITSEIYLTEDNELVHPRLLITRYGTRNAKATAALGLRKVWGRQFRYCYFLCGHKRRKELLRESPFDWGQPYPKTKDMVWKEQKAGEVSRETHNPPRIERSVRFRQPAPLFDD